jgi:hypothetical protein
MKGVASDRRAEKKMIVTMNSKEVLKRRAEARFKQEARALDGRKAMTEYETQVLAIREKTARLKALRLAKEAQALATREKAARLTALRLAKKAQAQSDEPAPKTKVRSLKNNNRVLSSSPKTSA